MTEEMRNCYDCTHCRLLYLKMYSHYRPMCDYVLCAKTREPKFMFSAIRCNQYELRKEGELQDEQM